MAALRLKALALSALVLAPASAAAQTIEEAQVAKIEELREQVAGQIHLAAYNLVDELIYGWTQAPAFDEPTPVVLAGVTVPVGTGTALQSLLENHITSVLLKNPSANLQLVHCPACTAMLVHSGPEGTVISKGVDNPDALAKFDGSTTKYALFVDVEAEGTWLVLRARLTRLDEGLAVVWARTISSAASAPSMLRAPDDLKSAAEARDEMLDALNDRWLINVPIRFSVRLYQDEQGTVNPPPILWFMSGLELALSQERAWTASVLVGYGYVPSSFDAIMGQLRINRLLTGTSRSFTRPDLYAFVGTSIFGTSGPTAQIFARNSLSVEDVLAMADNEPPIQVFAAMHVGLEMRIGNRLGMTFFMEMLPAHLGSDILGTYLGIFQSIGGEIAVWF